MISVTFYTFSKRENSTAVPTGGTAVSCVLKEQTSLLAPSFLLHWESRPTWTAAFFEGRYYFVTDIMSVRNDQWEVSCRVDVLATYKTQIGATTAFILYDTAANTEIIDQRLAPKTTKTRLQNSAALDPSLMTGSAGKVVLSVVGEDTTDTYIVTMGQVKDLLNGQTFANFFGGSEVWGPIDADLTGSFITDTMTAIMTLIKSVGVAVKNVMGSTKLLDCIKSAVWIPWDISGDGQPVHIKLGLYTSDVVAAPIVNPLIWDTVDIAIPWQAADWRRNAPYHHIYVSIPFIGTVEVPPGDIIGESTITILWALNKLDGNLNVQMSAGNHILGVYAASTGVSIPIGASNITPGRATTSLLSGIAAAAAAGPGGASIGAAAALAVGQINSLVPQPSSVGGGGGGAASKLDLSIRVTTVFHDTDAAPPLLPRRSARLHCSLSSFHRCRASSSVRARLYRLRRRMQRERP